MSADAEREATTIDALGAMLVLTDQATLDTLTRTLAAAERVAGKHRAAGADWPARFLPGVGSARAQLAGLMVGEPRFVDLDALKAIGVAVSSLRDLVTREPDYAAELGVEPAALRALAGSVRETVLALRIARQARLS